MEILNNIRSVIYESMKYIFMCIIQKNIQFIEHDNSCNCKRFFFAI